MLLTYLPTYVLMCFTSSTLHFYILFYYYIWRCAGDDGVCGIEAIQGEKVVRMTVMVKVSYH